MAETGAFEGQAAIEALHARGHLHDAEILDFAYDKADGGRLTLIVAADPETPCELPSNNRLHVVLAGISQPAPADIDPAYHVGYGIGSFEVDLVAGWVFLNASVCGFRAPVRGFTLQMV